MEKGRKRMGSSETQARLERGRGQMSDDLDDNVEELVFILRAMRSLWKVFAGASYGYVCISLK